MAKTNNTAEKALLNSEKIANAMRESTEKTLRSILNEAISDFIEKDDADEEGAKKEDEQSIDNDSFEVEDVKTGTEDTPSDDADSSADNSEEDHSDDEEGGAEDKWADMEQFKVDDNNYDFTGEDGEMALKVYSQLGDDDQICIKPEGDGKWTMTDDETGAEYVIELGNDGDVDSDAVDADDVEPEVTDGDVEDGEDNVEDVEDTFEVDLDGFGDDEDGVDSEEVVVDDDEVVDDSDELNEDLGYTDSYQKKDPIEGLKMNEPADQKNTNDWDEGAPKSTEKPWAGKGDNQPFEKQVNECGVSEEGAELEEATTVGGAVQQHSMSKSNEPKSRKENSPKVQHNVSAAGEFDAQLSESIKKIVSKAREIQAENQQYKAAIEGIKKSLYEAAILNANYGKVVNLLVNETTTKDEKVRIVERFSNIKTIKEGKQLYDTIKQELNESAKKATPIVERTITTEPSNKINETPIYTPQTNASLNLMERMDRLYKKEKKDANFQLNENKSLDLMARVENLHKKPNNKKD